MNNLNIDDIIFDVLRLCQKKKLNENDITMLKYIFENQLIDVNFDNGRFILSASFFGNYDMLKIMKEYGADMYIDNDKPYKLALQNNNIDCMKILNDKK